MSDDEDEFFDAEEEFNDAEEESEPPAHVVDESESQVVEDPEAAAAAAQKAAAEALAKAQQAAEQAAEAAAAAAAAEEEAARAKAERDTASNAGSIDYGANGAAEVDSIGASVAQVPQGPRAEEPVSIAQPPPQPPRRDDESVAVTVPHLDGGGETSKQTDVVAATPDASAPSDDLSTDLTPTEQLESERVVDGSPGRTTEMANQLIRQLSQKSSSIASDDAALAGTNESDAGAGNEVEPSVPPTVLEGDETSDDEEEGLNQRQGVTSSSASASVGGGASAHKISIEPSDPLPENFDHEAVYKMTNKETGEVFDVRTFRPWDERHSAAKSDVTLSNDVGDDHFRQRGLIPTRDMLLDHAKGLQRSSDESEISSGAPIGGNESSSASSASAGASGEGGGTKPKRSIFARAAHKVDKRMKAAAEKLKDKLNEKEGEAHSDNLTADGQVRQYVVPGQEQTGDHVKVSVHGKDYSEWSSLFLVQGVAAHDGPIWCVAWSLSGMFLASAGQDKIINVWKAIESRDQLPPAWQQKGPEEKTKMKPGDIGLSAAEEGNAANNELGTSCSGFAARNSHRKWNCPVVCEDFTGEDEAMEMHRRHETRGTSGVHEVGVDTDEAGKNPDCSGSKESNPGSQGPGFHSVEPFRRWRGHTGDIVDLSWNQNDFLLSASIDRTVRLWHVSTSEPLHTFPHSDFVTSVDFHPRNDLLFLSGCFDKRLRVWSIPESHVAAWATTPEMITSVRFSPNGAQALAGLFNGQVFFWHTDQAQVVHPTHPGADGAGGSGGSGVGGGSGDSQMMGNSIRRHTGSPSSIHHPMSTENVQLRYYTQIEARNRRGKFQHGRKVTGLCWLPAQALKVKELRSNVSHETGFGDDNAQLRSTEDDASGISMIPSSSRSKTVSESQQRDVPTRRPVSAIGSSAGVGKPNAQSLPQQLLVTTNDSRIRLFQMETFSQLCKFKGQANENLQIAGSFSSDGKYVVAGSDTGHVHVWNTTNVYAEALDGVGEHGVQVRGGWRNAMASAAGASKGKHDRNTSRESFMATVAVKGSKDNPNSSSSANSCQTPAEDRGSESSTSQQEKALPCIATAAVFAPFATVSLVAAASEVHMLYNDLEQLANSIIVVADYTGKLRFYMRASASEEEELQS